MRTIVLPLLNDDLARDEYQYLVRADDYHPALSLVGGQERISHVRNSWGS